MIIEAEYELKKEWYEDSEELVLVKQRIKQQLVTKIAETMLNIGLIKIEERNVKEHGDMVIRATTVALNPEQLSYISSMLAFTGVERQVMDEIKNK